MELNETLTPGARDLHLPARELEIRRVVAEASRALALLDADRLEELAAACVALNRRLEALPRSSQLPNDRKLVGQVRGAESEMETFRRVLEATRANLTVIRRLRRSDKTHLEYSEAHARGWAQSEPHYGDN
jgi:hypothetical protein